MNKNKKKKIQKVLLKSMTKLLYYLDKLCGKKYWLPFIIYIVIKAALINKMMLLLHAIFNTYVIY